MEHLTPIEWGSLEHAILVHVPIPVAQLLAP